MYSNMNNNLGIVPDDQHVDDSTAHPLVEEERAAWLMVHPAHAATVSPCLSDFVYALTDPKEQTRAAAISNAVLESGIHRITYAVQGDAIVGVASADETDDKDAPPRAWGLSTATGCLTYASNAMQDDLVGEELGPQRMANDAVARIVEFEVNCQTSRMRLRCRQMDKDSLSFCWKEVPVSLPEAVRPWALIPGRSDDCDVLPAVRLVSCVRLSAPLQH